MDCPQCGAVVPSDDLFCGKCGYAMRDEGPERLDRSRIRMHEEPEWPAGDSQSRSSSQQRVRKHTVLGMPSVTPPRGSRPPTPAPAPVVPSPPTSITSARAGGSRTRTPQKTMLGIPRHEIPEPPSDPSSAESAVDEPAHASEEGAPSEATTPSHRVRARVLYDSANEPFPVTQRRKKALLGLAILVLFASAWLGYRYLTLNG